MKKNILKKLAYILTFVMMFSITAPKSVIAADGDVTGITIKGVTADISGGNSTFDDVVGKTVAIPYAAANTKSAPSVTFENTEGAALTWAKLDASTSPKAGTVIEGDLTNLFTSNVYTDGELKDGDELWAKDGGGKHYQFKITVGTNHGGSIGGTNEVENVVLNVILPTSLDFALDPYELNKENTQIKSTDYAIINKSSVAVQVEFELSAALNEGVELVDDVTELSKDDTEMKDKKLYFAAVGAKSVGDTAPTFANTQGSYVYDYSVAGTVAPFNAAENKTSISFALGKATIAEPSALATDNKGIASFTFIGDLNTYASWALNDIEIEGAYTLIPLRAGTYGVYTATETSRIVANSLNMLSKTPAYDIELSETDETATVTISNMLSADSLRINLKWKPDSIIEIMDGEGTPISSYTYSNGLLTITSLTDASKSEGIYISTVAGAYYEILFE